MLVLTSYCPGKADHAILNVEASIENQKLIIVAKDSYYNDYNSSAIPEAERIYTDEINVEGIEVDRQLLFEKIKELLKKNNNNDYHFTLDDIKPINPPLDLDGIKPAEHAQTKKSNKIGLAKIKTILKVIRIIACVPLVLVPLASIILVLWCTISYGVPDGLNSLFLIPAALMEYWDPLCVCLIVVILTTVILHEKCKEK